MPRALRAIKALFVSDRGEEEGPAFRIYAFKSGAWPELILGAVMGAAGRIEAERRRERSSAPIETSPAPTADAAHIEPQEPFELPGLKSVRSSKLRSPFRPRSGSPAAPASGSRATAPQASVTIAPASAKPEFRQRFGTYAGHAQAEFATYSDVEEEAQAVAAEREQQRAVARPANSGQNVGQGAHVTDADPETADIVVPFPAQRPAPASRTPDEALTDRLATALAAGEQAAGADDEPTIGVELRRETATFRVPVSQASLPKALARLTGTTLEAADRDAPMIEAALAAPQPLGSDEARSATEVMTEQPPAGDAAGFEPPLVLRRRVD